MSTTAVSNDFSDVIRDWLTANRPAGVPVTVEYRAAADRAALARPYFVAACDGVAVQSRILYTGEILLRMRTRADDQAATDAATWHHASAAALSANLEALRDAMQAKGYWLRHMIPGDYEDALDGPRGRAYVQRWKFLIQTGLP